MSRSGKTAVALMIAVFSWIVATYRLRAYDLFWHLAGGAWILDHGAVPRIDPFRFTGDSIPWIDHGWLFQLGIRAVEVFGGLNGLVLARAAVGTALALLLLFGLFRNGTPPVGAGLVAALAILGARPRLMMRPELASLAGTLLLLLLLQRFRRRPTVLQASVVIGIVVLWANLHPSVLVAPWLTGMFLLGTRLPGGGKPRGSGAASPGWGWVLGLPGAMALAVALNPYGLGLYRVPLGIGRALEDLSAFNPEWQPAWAAPQPFFVGCVLLLGLLATLTWRLTGGVDPATGLAALLLAGLALSGVRHQGLFMIGCAVFAGQCLTDLDRGRAGWREVAGRAAWLSLVAVVVLGIVWCVWPPRTGPLRPRIGPYTFGLGIQDGRFPVQAANALERLAPQGARLYNDVAFGGYLLWRGYPDRRVFIDGRNEVNPALLGELARSRNDSRLWSDLLARYGVDGAVVRYDERLRKVIAPQPDGDGRRVGYRTTHALLFPRRQFALVHWDDQAMVFLRREALEETEIAAVEYRFVDPEDIGTTLERAAADPLFLAGAVAETERRLAEDPGCLRARDIRERLIVSSLEARTPR